MIIREIFKSFAEIKEKSIIAGVFERVEIWEEDAWKAYTAEIERDANAFAEKVGDAA